MSAIIVSDHDVKFTLEFWMLLTKRTKTKLKFNTIFYPQTDGQTKRINRIYNQYFRKYIANDHKDWGDHLGLTKFCYNSTKH
jgi:hypothetical protein